MPPTERPLPPIQETGFLGMHASTEYPVPTGFVSLAENFYLKGRVWKPRPGLKQAGATLSTGNPIQCLAHFQQLDGTLFTVAICNADIFFYNWGTDSWSTTDLAGAGITVDSSAKVDWAVSRGRIIFTDGVNKPFMYDPSGPTYTTLSNAPIAGGVEIYYDKVFFYDLVGVDSNVFEWSDEGDPVNGYTGQNQDWEFAQSDTGSITAMAGLNEIMPVWKEDSIAVLKGAVEDTFQTDANREGISDTEGTPGKHTVQVVESDVYYLAKNGPRILRQGVKRVPLDYDADGVNTLDPIWDLFDKDEIRNAISMLDTERGHVIWLMSLAGETTKYTGLLYAAQEGTFSKLSFDATFDFTSLAKTEDNDGNEYMLMGTADGKVYIYGDEANTDDAGTDFTMRLRSRQYGSSIAIVQKRLVQLDLLVNVLSATADMKSRPYIDGKDESFFVLAERQSGWDTTGLKRWRRAFNHSGYTVGWDIEVQALTGQIEIHSAITALTTSSQHSSRG